MTSPIAAGLTQADLEYRLLYAPVVAGKSAGFAEQALDRLLDPVLTFAAAPRCSPFEIIRHMIRWRMLRQCLEDARTGSYGRLERCLPALVELDPATCTIEDLEAVHGIGPKSARFFVLWTRPAERCAALDVHVLRWLRAQGYAAPRSTPSNPKRYADLEAAFLSEADQRGMTARELDAEIWTAGNVGGIQ